MNHYASAITGRLPLVLLLFSLAGCDWVDSTGVQGATVTASLRNGEALPLTENVPLTAPLAGEGAELTGWRWEIDGTDVQGRCNAFNGFDEQLAVDSLNDACSDRNNCSFAIDETSSEDSATSFTLQLPSLRAPVALSYRLLANRSDGTVLERQQLFCGLSINEAPSADDDNYLAIPGEVLVVAADAGNSLLANDKDDDDVRNSALTVSGIITQPAHAAQFSFDPDGGFLYEPRSDIPLDARGFAEDRFVYSVTDGLHQVTGTAVLRVAADNEAPVRLQAVPDTSLTVTAGIETSSPEAQLLDLSIYFSDPDGDTLTFFIPAEQLPASGNITLSPAGLLRAEPNLTDIGRYRIELLVSDGLESISDAFLLSVVEPDADPDNTAPRVSDISNRIVRKKFKYDIRRFFSDPDGDTLEFSAEGLPDDVEISTKGVISGESGRSNQGRWLVRVNASDGKGGTVSDAFQLDIR
ncbi:Ig-like domain-containing protein [Granulosicoccus sp. 3-233]|uniref:Ig-like domain-containing protein n=1 Tax=Granulosicoccus sp. 3-233 TaxID=3417969 RepID=UPI003D334EB4